jgi:ribosome-associated protein
MDDDLTIKEGIAIPASELWFTASRSGGPGGQHVNKTSSRVTLHWHIGNSTALTSPEKVRVMTRLAGRISGDGVLQVDVDTERSQHRNLEIARERLAALVREALSTPKKRIPTRVSRQARQRRLDEKSHRSTTKKLRSKPGEND